MDTELVGHVIADRYRVDALLARGGMGVVYRATQLAVGRSVALKVLTSERRDGGARERFELEARSLAQLSHPHVVSLVDYGVDDVGRAYLVMEHLEGEPLSALIAREAPLHEDRVTAIAIQLLRALAAAHDRGLVHRDLKPSNVFVVRYDVAGDFVKVLDFGIAKPLGGPVDLTTSRDVIGSPRYISPEQAARRPVTAASDLYALGCVLYELLTGRAVFDDEDSALGCLLAHAQREPEPPAVDGVRLTSPVAEWTLRCLAKAPWERPASAKEMLQALRGGPADATTSTSGAVASERGAGVSRRAPWRASTAVVLGGALLGLVAALVLPQTGGGSPATVPTRDGAVAAPSEATVGEPARPVFGEATVGEPARPVVGEVVAPVVGSVAARAVGPHDEPVDGHDGARRVSPEESATAQDEPEPAGESAVDPVADPGSSGSSAAAAAGEAALGDPVSTAAEAPVAPRRAAAPVTRLPVVDPKRDGADPAPSRGGGRAYEFLPIDLEAP